MNHLEQLRALCKEQGRGLFTSECNNYSSIVLTQVGNCESIHASESGKKSLEEYASLLLEGMGK